MFSSLFSFFSKPKKDDDNLESSSSCEDSSPFSESTDVFCTPHSQLRDSNNGDGVVSSSTPYSPLTLTTNFQDEQKSSEEKENLVPLEKVAQSCFVNSGSHNKRIRDVLENLPLCQDEFSVATCYISPTTKKELQSARDQVKRDEGVRVSPELNPRLKGRVTACTQSTTVHVFNNTDFSSPAIRDLCTKFQNMTISEKGLGKVNDRESIILCGKPRDFVLPPKISKFLRHSSHDGLKWLWGRHSEQRGGILGDCMDLGKTMQMCIFLAGLFHSQLVRRVLIVVSRTRLPHWIKILSTVGLLEKIREYTGKTRKQALQYIFQNNGILLTTYDTFSRNFQSIRGDSTIAGKNDDGMIWDYSIHDEGHQIKNPRTQRSKRLLAMPSSLRIVVCGRPVEENLKELSALFRYCCPELLGDEKEFKEKYESAINRGKRKNATSREKRKATAVAKELSELIKPYLFKRLKSEVCHEE